MSRRGQKRPPSAGDRPPGAGWLAWLLGEGPAPAAPDPSALAAQGFLADPAGPLPAVVEPLATALVEALAAHNDDAALARLAEAPSRPLAKAARKALHHRRRQGPAPQAAPGTRPPGPATPATADAANRRATMTVPFGDGDRVVVFRFRAVGDRRLHAGVATLSDERGLRDFQLFLGSAKLYQGMAREAGQRVPAAEIPFDFAAALMEAAAARSQALGRLLPEHWRAWRSLVRPEADALVPHPAEALVPAPLPDDAALFALWSTPELRSWMPATAALEALAARFAEISGSALVLSEEQRLERLQEALDDALVALLQDPGRAWWAARLLDVAWVAAAHRRELVAGQVLAVRADLLASTAPQRLAFCRQLVVRPFLPQLPPAVAAALAPGVPSAPEAAPPPPEGPLIWTPDQGTDPQGGAPGTGGLIIPGR